MNPEERHEPAEPRDASSAGAQAEREVLESGTAEETLSPLPQVEPSEPAVALGPEFEDAREQETPDALPQLDDPETVAIEEQQATSDKIPLSLVVRESEPAGATPSIVAEPVPGPKTKSFFRERPPQIIEVAPNVLRHWTRRDVLLFGAGAIAALAGGGSLLPQATLERLGVTHRNKPWPGKEWLLNKALRIDDDVAEALYSQNRLVPTYTKSQITPLKNNYNGATPDPGYIPGWHLTLDGLASGRSVRLNIRNLLTRFQVHEQITRLVCVEGWSAIAWWSGLKFDDLLRAYPPISQAKWARVDSSVNLDPWGNPDPYFASLDLPTARHPQTLLATHFNGKPLTVDHGAPLRLLVPVKLGLKNVKAITRITYMEKEPKDYWAERGYSRYDGI
ncbi:MAG TPA: molybdopterin-dependent oxidoreductase [Acidobacteriaceae bacterium]|nr:molybdopterin-dependent oxidoreductase [Acidobacteriaceae bacterium]